MKERKAAKLILEDGQEFHGFSFAKEKSIDGEVVFNTGMVGYPETLTDPSYRGQILVLTYPLVGNYGVPGSDLENGMPKYFESDRIQIQGLLVTDYSDDYSHWNAKKSLGQWLSENDIPALTGIDTRTLTKKLRSQGTMLGRIVFDDEKDVVLEDPNKRNLVSEVSIKEPKEYTKGSKRIILIDCGVKNNIIQSFLRRDITVIRVPWNYDFTKIKANGILISNGPGDPKMCPESVENVRRVMGLNLPMLGICLGSQILGLAAGADTFKLKYGHRSQNQPCAETGTRRCYITSQNHGYAVNTKTLTEDWREWFYNDNDGTNEGILHISKPFFGAQFHPEASPGPDDSEFIFDMFLRAMD
jgi:carbamoyl-phosphate synthase small subunit